MSVKGKDRAGRIPTGCTRHRQSRGCPAPRTWYLDQIEHQVIGLLRSELDRPNLLGLCVREYNKALLEYARAQIGRRAKLQRSIDDLQAETDRLLKFVARGIGDVERIADEYDTKCRMLADARAEIALEPEPLTAVALHPLAIEGYRKDLAQLAPLMATDLSTGQNGFAESLRRLVETVTVGENTAGQMEITITGRLRSLIDAPALKRRLMGGALVAEEGFEPPTQGL